MGNRPANHSVSTRKPCRSTSGKVSWLVGSEGFRLRRRSSSSPAWPSGCGSTSSLTVAGPRRLRTGFPFMPSGHPKHILIVNARRCTPPPSRVSSPRLGACQARVWARVKPASPAVGHERFPVLGRARYRLDVVAHRHGALAILFGSEGRKAFSAGVILLQDPDGAKYDEALVQFKRAYELVGSWKVLGNYPGLRENARPSHAPGRPPPRRTLVGKNPRNLTHTTGFDYSPNWSPDGSRIAFVSERDGNAEIYVMNADGTGQRRITNDPAFESLGTAAWSPDGKRLTTWPPSAGKSRQSTVGRIFAGWIVDPLRERVAHRARRPVGASRDGRRRTQRPSPLAALRAELASLIRPAFRRPTP